MKKVYSQYKVFGGFGFLLGFNLLIGFLVYKGLLVGENIQLTNLHSWLYNDNYKVVLFLLGIQSLFLFLFCTQNRYIVVDKEYITFINPLFQFFRTKRKWSDYDFFQTIEEQARGGTYEAVWLIKDNKVRSRFSSFYYSNYHDLKSGLNVRYRGQLYVNPFMQFFYILGLRLR